LWPLYRAFGESLREKGIAYEGMVFRDVVSGMNNELPGILSAYDYFHFIGFNALNNCEKRLMRLLEGRRQMPVLLGLP
jgi:hypothetical protein